MGKKKRGGRQQSASARLAVAAALTSSRMAAMSLDDSADASDNSDHVDIDVDGMSTSTSGDSMSTTCGGTSASAEQHQQQQLPAVMCLKLRLVRSKASNKGNMGSLGSSNRNSDNVIEISPADAVTIDVLDEEQVLCLPLDQSGSGDGDDSEDITALRVLSARLRRKRKEVTSSTGTLQESEIMETEMIIDNKSPAGSAEESGTNDVLVRIPSAAVCTVRIAKLDSHRKKQSAKGSVKDGEAEVQPASLLARLFGDDDDESVFELKTNDNRITCTTPATPSTPSSTTSPSPIASPSQSGSKFSFARGGGGDSLISPSQSSFTSPSSHRNSRAKSQSLLKYVAIIPLHQLSALPEHCQNSLIRRATELVLSTVSSTIPNLATHIGAERNTGPKRGSKRPTKADGEVIQRSGTLLKEMVLQTFMGRRVQIGDVLNAPFLGCSVQLRVEAASCSSPFDVDDATNSLGGVKEPVNNELEYQQSTILKSLGAILATASASSHHFAALYQIGQTTNVAFGKASKKAVGDSDDDDNENVKQGPGDATGSNWGDEVDGKLVAGLDLALQEVKSILIPPLYHPEMFSPKGGPMRPPRGILLHGPSGVGKSRLAAQVGRELSSTTTSMSGGDISLGAGTDSGIGKRRKIIVETIPCATIQSYSSIVGQAEKALCKIFDRAEHRASKGISSLLIMDDVQLISPRRGSADAGNIAGITSTLLALLDGIGQDSVGSNSTAGELNESVGLGTAMILAITSDPSHLDPALRRPGRLDSEVEVASPTDENRAAILEFLLNELGRKRKGSSAAIELPPLSKEDFSALARLAKGFTGADCSLALKEAVRCAILRCEQAEDPSPSIEVTLEDLKHAIRLTKPSQLRAVTVEVPHVPWASIGGMEHVKRSLREAIELPVTHGHLFDQLSVLPPRGMLLYGPPGCSKTMMARALATEGNMNFLAVKGPELLSKWLGESERALASLFRRARLASPCILFFDEIDSIAAKRGSGGSGSGERLLSQLLTELDGVSSTNSVGTADDKTGKAPPRVVVVGATNRPDLLDPALTRPGRIDRKIYVGLPDKESRIGILNVGLKGKACGDDVDISNLAGDDITGGFSGAELISICRESALYALEDIGSGAKISTRHLLESIQFAKRQITPEMLAFYKQYQEAN